MAIDPKLADALAAIGIVPGDTVLAVFGDGICPSLGTPDGIVAELMDVVQSSGTLAVPAFTFSTAEEKLLIPLFAEALLGMPGAVISDHPTHPLAAAGKLASAIAHKHGSDSAFGSNTPVFRLLQADAKLLQLGAEFSANPVVFVAEEIAGVPYVSRSRPISITLPSGRAVTRWIRQPGCHRGFGVLADTLRTTGALTESAVGDNSLALVSARSVYHAAREALSISADALLCLEPSCQMCAEARAIIDASSAEEADKKVAEQAEEDEMMTRELERKLNGGMARFVDSTDAGFSSN